MKKMYNLLTAIALTCISTSPILAKIFIQNNYDAKNNIRIQCVELPASKANSFVALPPLAVLGYGSSVEVSRWGRYERPWAHQHYLSISTVGDKYSDISYIYDKIRQEVPHHQNEDAIIMIQPSWGVYGWNLTVEWVKPSSIISK